MFQTRLRTLQTGRDDWGYSNKILKTYGNTTLHTIPENFEPLPVPGTISDISLKTIEAITKLIISLVTTSDLLSKGDGTLIGGSSSSEAELMKNFIVGHHNAIIEVFKPMLNDILQYNGYTNLIVDLQIPATKFKNETLDIEKAKLILDAAKSGFFIASPNELREYMELENASDDFFKETVEEWQLIKQAMEKIQQEKQEEGQSQNPNFDKNKAKKEEQLNEEEVQQAEKEEQVKKNQIKNNQKIPTREEIEAELLPELQAHFEEYYETLLKMSK